MAWQVFDHTADLGIRVEAATLPALFEEAARALAALLVEEPEAVPECREEAFALRAGDPADLLFDWLHELLVAFELRRVLLSRTEVALEEPPAEAGPGRGPGAGPWAGVGAALRARAWGAPYDPERHRPAREVKAITYHGLDLRREADGWVAEVVVDV